MTLRLNGDNSGFTEIKAADTAGDNSIKLPASNGSANQLLQNGGTAGELQYTSAGGGLHYDSSGRLLVGTSTSRGDGSPFQVVNDTANPIEVFRGQTGVFGPTLLLNKSRGSTASPSVVSQDDQLGAIVFKGYSGAAGAYRDAALIEARVDGQPDTSGDTTDMPGRLVFSTTADGASSPTERMRITSTGQMRLAGAGITFNGDTASANELDDYEEGNGYTVMYGTSGNPSVWSGNFLSYYTKIGRFVYFNYGSNITTWTSAGSGSFYITVPFTCANLNSPTSQPMHGISTVHHNGFFNVTNVIAKIEQNSNRVYFYQTGSTTPLTWSNVVQNKFVSMQLTYNAAT